MRCCKILRVSKPQLNFSFRILQVLIADIVGIAVSELKSGKLFSVLFLKTYVFSLQFNGEQKLWLIRMYYIF